MRVLIWGNSYPRVGGVETFVTNLVQALRARGVELAVVSDGSVSMELDDPFPITMVPMTKPLKAAEPEGIMQAMKVLRGVIARFRPDAIHYNMCGAEIFFFDRLMQTLTVPAVVTFHNAAFEDTRSIAGIFERVIDRAVAATAVSNTIRRAAAQHFGRSGETLRLIPNAIAAQRLTQPYPWNGHVLALGRLVHDKGMDTLVEAFAIVHRARPEARLTVAGDGPELGALRARAEELGIAGAVSFPGWIEPAAVHEAMGGAAIVAFPSRWEEPFGLVALEAAQAARPCVATRVGELPDIVRDGETGHLVPRDDPAAMAEALLRLIEAPAMAATMGQRARLWVDERYNFNAMVDAYLDLLRQACARPE